MQVTVRGGKVVEVEIPKGWRLMVKGEVFTRKDRLYCDTGVPTIEKWLCFRDLIGWNIEDMGFVCIRKLDARERASEPMSDCGECPKCGEQVRIEHGENCPACGTVCF